MTELLPLQDEDFERTENGINITSSSSSAENTNKETSEKRNQKAPGVVLGRDGKPCRACTAFKDWSKQERKKPRKNISTGSESSPPETLQSPQDCPPDTVVLGRATWTLLHSIAAYYPDKPTTSQQSSIKSFLASFSDFYPCWHCADHLREELKRHPPKVENQRAFSRWMCQVHNEVNKRLGKKVFDCEKVNERWKDGWADGRCD